LPDQRVGLDHFQTKQIVELIEREDLDLIGRQTDVPKLFVGHV
jgi:hypothetical protein